MNITHGVVTCDEFLIQSRVLVVNTRVHHGDVHISARVSQIPGTHGVKTGVACFHSRCLDVTVEHDTSVAFHHHHILKRCKFEDQTGVDLTEQYGVHRFNDVDHAEVHEIQFGKMFCINLHAIRKTDTRDALEGFQTVVDVVSILVE